VWAYSSYPKGLDLNTVTQIYGKGALDARKIAFMGVPAIQFTSLDGTRKKTETYLFKNSTMYSLSFSSPSNVFNEFWPEISAAWQGIKF
jgi:hypothetical protein